MDRLEDGLDRLPLTLSLEDLGFAVGLRPQDQRLPITFRGEDGGLLAPLGGQDRGLALALRSEDDRTLLAVRPHLLLHRVLDRRGWVDALQLHTVHPHPPLAGGLVEDSAQPAVDLVAAGQRLLEVHPTDDVAKGGYRELLEAWM